MLLFLANSLGLMNMRIAVRESVESGKEREREKERD